MSLTNFITQLGAAGVKKPSIEYVATIENSTSGGSQIFLFTSGLGIQTGDLVVALESCGAPSSKLSSMNCSTLDLYDSAYYNDTYDVSMKVYSKVLTSVPSYFLFQDVADSNAAHAASILVFRNASGLSNTVKTGGSNAYNVNFGNISGLGSRSWVVGCGASASNTGLTGYLDTSQADWDFANDRGVNVATSDLTQGIAYKDMLGASSFSPTTWTLSGGTPSFSSWAGLLAEVLPL